MDVTDALRALSLVQEELAATPAEDLLGRRRLRDREIEIRAELRSFSERWTDHLSIDQLKRKIEELERRLGDHYGSRLSHLSGGQSGFGGGIDPTILHRMHRAMDQTGDLSARKAELARLKQKLHLLEHDG